MDESKKMKDKLCEGFWSWSSCRKDMKLVVVITPNNTLEQVVKITSMMVMEFGGGDDFELVFQ